MAEEQKIVDIRVKTADAVKGIVELKNKMAELKKEEKELKEAIQEGNGDIEENKQKLVQVEEQEKALRKETQALSKEVQNNIKANKQNGDSLNELRAQLSLLTAEYDNLSRAEREGAKGAELKAHINDITNVLKSGEEGTQRYYRNVGNYTKSITKGFRAMGGASSSLINPLSGVSLGLKAISSTPIIAILGLLINIVSKVIAEMKKNEEAVNAVREALAPLNSISTLFSKTLEILGKGIVAISKKLGEWLNKLGILKKEMQTEQAIVKDEIALNKQRRKVAEENAKTEYEISELKAKAVDKEKYTASERIKMWEEVGEKEKKISRNNMELAKEELRIAEEKAKLTANSEEEENKLTELRVKATDAERNYMEKVREVTANIVRIRREERRETKAAASEAKRERNEQIKEEKQEFKDRKKLLEDDIKDRIAIAKNGSDEELQLKREQMKTAYDLAVEEITRSEAQEDVKQKRLASLRAKYQFDEKVLLQEHNNALIEIAKQHATNMVNSTIEGTKERISAELEQARLELESMHQMVDETDAQWNERRLAAQIAFNNRKKELEKADLEITLAKYEAIGAIIGSISSTMEGLSDQNEAMVKTAKVLALAQIAIESGVATAKGIKQAQSVPFPANIAAIATTITAILSGITSAVSTVKSVKFATGGYVSGSGTGTSDSISARLSNGESVLNANSTSMFAPLISALNQFGGGIPVNVSNVSNAAMGEDMLARAFAKGASQIQPQVAVTEIGSVATRVNVVETLGDI